MFKIKNKRYIYDVGNKQEQEDQTYPVIETKSQVIPGKIKEGDDISPVTKKTLKNYLAQLTLGIIGPTSITKAVEDFNQSENILDVIDDSIDVSKALRTANEFPIIPTDLSSISRATEEFDAFIPGTPLSDLDSISFAQRTKYFSDDVYKNDNNALNSLKKEGFVVGKKITIGSFSLGKMNGNNMLFNGKKSFVDVFNNDEDTNLKKIVNNYTEKNLKTFNNFFPNLSADSTTITNKNDVRQVYIDQNRDIDGFDFDPNPIDKDGNILTFLSTDGKGSIIKENIPIRNLKGYAESEKPFINSIKYKQSTKSPMLMRSALLRLKDFSSEQKTAEAEKTYLNGIFNYSEKLLINDQDVKNTRTISDMMKTALSVFNIHLNYLTGDDKITTAHHYGFNNEPWKNDNKKYQKGSYKYTEENKNDLRPTFETDNSFKLNSNSFFNKPSNTQLKKNLNEASKDISDMPTFSIYNPEIFNLAKNILNDSTKPEDLRKVIVSLFYAVIKDLEFKKKLIGVEIANNNQTLLKELIKSLKIFKLSKYLLMLGILENVNDKKPWLNLDNPQNDIKRLDNRATKSDSFYNSVDNRKENEEALLNELNANKDTNTGQQTFPFYFQDLRTNKFISFHAFIESINDSYSPSYETIDSIGRIEPIQIYKSTTRKIDVNFIVHAVNQEDFKVMWQKLNDFLMLIYPQFSRGRELSNGKVVPFSQIASAGPVVRMRIGDLIKSDHSTENLSRLGAEGIIINHFEAASKGLAGVIDSLSYSFENATWEIEEGLQAPKLVKIQIGFTVIHDIIPGLDRYGLARSNVYYMQEKPTNLQEIVTALDKNESGKGGFNLSEDQIAEAVEFGKKQTDLKDKIENAIVTALNEIFDSESANAAFDIKKKVIIPRVNIKLDKFYVDVNPETNEVTNIEGVDQKFLSHFSKNLIQFPEAEQKFYYKYIEGETNIQNSNKFSSYSNGNFGNQIYVALIKGDGTKRKDTFVKGFYSAIYASYFYVIKSNSGSIVGDKQNIITKEGKQLKTFKQDAIQLYVIIEPELSNFMSFNFDKKGNINVNIDKKKMQFIVSVVDYAVIGFDFIKNLKLDSSIIDSEENINKKLNITQSTTTQEQEQQPKKPEISAEIEKLLEEQDKFVAKYIQELEDTYMLDMNIRKNSYLISKSEFDEQIKDEGKLAGINKKIEENTYYKRLIELKINELTLKKQDLNKNSSQIDEENKQLNEQIAQLQDIIDGDGISEENLKFFEGVEIEKDKEAIAAEANQQSEKTDDKAPAGNVSTSGKKGTGTKPSGEKMPPGLNEVDKIKWKKANGYRLNSTEQATLNMIERAAAKEAAAKKSVVDSVDAAAKTAKEYGSAAIRYLGSIGEDSEKNSGENLLPKGIPGQERFGSKTPNPSGVSRIPGSDQFTPIPK